MKIYFRLFVLVIVLVFQSGCMSFFVRVEGMPLECDANLGTNIYQGTLSDLSGVFLFGTLSEDAYTQETSFGQRLGLAVLMFPFALIDLPFSFLAESTVYLPGSIENHKVRVEQCEKKAAL